MLDKGMVCRLRNRPSAAQRSKVAGRGCVVCGRRPSLAVRLVPARLGGCRSAECVIALCRTDQVAYESGELSLAPYVEAGFEVELAHAVAHVGADRLGRALHGGGWE